MAVYDKTLNKSVTAVIYQESRLWTQLCSIAKIPVAGWSFGHKIDVYWVDNYVVVYYNVCIQGKIEMVFYSLAFLWLWYLPISQLRKVYHS